MASTSTQINKSADSDDRLQKRLAAKEKRDAVLRIVIGVVVYIAAVFLLLVSALPSISKLEVGKPSPWDVKATHSIQIIDEQSWDKAKDQAAASVSPIETINSQALEISQNKLAATFNAIREAQKNLKTRKVTDKDATETNQQIPLNLTDETVKVLLSYSAPLLEQCYTNSEHVLGVVMQRGIREDELKNASDTIRQEAKALPGISKDQMEICAELASTALTPNKFVDYAATNRARVEARDKTEPVYKRVMRGQIVIREGDIVGEADLPVLEALGIYHHKITFSSLASSCAAVLLMLVICKLYITRYKPDIMGNMRKLAGLALLCLIFMIASRCLAAISPFLMPIAFTAMLTAILLDSRLAIMLVCLLGVYSGLMTGTIASTITVMFTGLISVLCVQNASKRWSLVEASLWVVLTNIATVLFISLSSQGELQDVVYSALMYGGLNGMLSSLMATGALPMLERAFKVTTHIRMLELANPSEPALHELLSRAPGTYMHSLMVANLAEAAAQAIGADSILCRAGAYYHDIGKMKQPTMFVENQMGHGNPHDTMPPHLSAMIITSHTYYGQELAAKYKLPDEIAKFIPEHHGTSMAFFFYSKALNESLKSGEPVFEEDYRYKGPRPQSKETAIVMICDGIEAASRTLADPSLERLRDLIDKMVKKLIETQQLDECPLSLKDIKAVKESILNTLHGQYHHRVAYPDAKKAQSKSAPAQKTSQTDGSRAPQAAGTVPASDNTAPAEKKD